MSTYLAHPQKRAKTIINVYKKKKTPLEKNLRKFKVLSTLHVIYVNPRRFKKTIFLSFQTNHMVDGLHMRRIS